MHARDAEVRADDVLLLFVQVEADQHFAIPLARQSTEHATHEVPGGLRLDLVYGARGVGSVLGQRRLDVHRRQQALVAAMVAQMIERRAEHVPRDDIGGQIDAAVQLRQRRHDRILQQVERQLPVAHATLEHRHQAGILGGERLVSLEPRCRRQPSVIRQWRPGGFDGRRTCGYAHDRSIARGAGTPSLGAERETQATRVSRPTRCAALAGTALLALALAGCENRTSVLPVRAEVVRNEAVAGEATTVELAVRPGERYVARLKRYEHDGSLEVLDAEGREQLRVRSPGNCLATEYASWTAESEGMVRVRALTPAPRVPTARLVLEVFRLPPGTSSRDATALDALTRAGRTSGALDDARKAAMLEDYRAAARAWTGREPKLAADSSLQVACVEYWLRDRWPEAIEWSERAAETFGELGDTAGTADALTLAVLGRLEQVRESAVTDPRRARELLARMAADAARVRDLYAGMKAPVQAGKTHAYVAAGHFHVGELDAAFAEWNRAVAALEAAGANRERAIVLSNLASARGEYGDYTGAGREYDRLLPLLGERRDEQAAGALVNGATVALYLGDFSRALDRYVRALSIARELAVQRLEANALLGIGITHLYLGQPDVARAHLDAALAVAPQSEVNQRVHTELRLADALLQLGETRLARAHLASAQDNARRGGTPLMRARVEVAAGNADALAGRHRDALARYSAALELGIPEDHSIFARALVGRARAARALGDTERARVDLERAARTSTANGNREEFVAATYERAELAADRGDVAAALEIASAAVDGIREIASGAADPESRITLAARLRSARELRVALLAEDSLAKRRAGDAAGAAARAFDALLATDAATSVADAGPRRTEPPAERARVLARLAERRYRLQTLAERHARPTPTMAVLEREIAMLRTRLAQLDAAHAGARAPVRAPAPARAATLQQRLAPGDVLLVYSLGAERSWLWIVGRDRFELVPLPAAATLDRGVGELLEAVRALHAPQLARAAAARLAAQILPPAALVPHARRLVVPDGALGAVPWALLSSAADEPVVQLASLVPMLAGEPLPARWQPRGELRLTLFGDPVFGSDDERLSRDARPVPVGTRGARDLARLPGTARELAAIAALGAPQSTTVVLGPDATRERLLGLRPGSVDVLHLATHATLDTAVPALASLVLSRRDRAGREIAGDVRTDDVLGMRAAPLLVVLSACDAAAEPSRSAAGLMNLTRAFLAGGARYVVASRWAVSDASAVALMTEFYRGLLRDGLPPDAALARAQATLAATPRWSAPFHWAGFVVTSDAP